MGVGGGGEGGGGVVGGGYNRLAVRRLRRGGAAASAACTEPTARVFLGWAGAREGESARVSRLVARLAPSAAVRRLRGGVEGTSRVAGGGRGSCSAHQAAASAFTLFAWDKPQRI